MSEQLQEQLRGRKAEGEDVNPLLTMAQAMQRMNDRIHNIEAWVSEAMLAAKDADTFEEFLSETNERAMEMAGRVKARVEGANGSGDDKEDDNESGEDHDPETD